MAHPTSAAMLRIPDGFARDFVPYPRARGDDCIEQRCRPHDEARFADVKADCCGELRFPGFDGRL